jgi:hypothetical protein
MDCYIDKSGFVGLLSISSLQPIVSHLNEISVIALSFVLSLPALYLRPMINLLYDNNLF